MHKLYHLSSLGNPSRILKYLESCKCSGNMRWHDLSCHSRKRNMTKKRSASKKKAAPKGKAVGTKRKSIAKKKTATKKRAAPKKTAKKNKLGVKNSLVNNINARKKKGKSRKKKNSTIDKKQYAQMERGWGKK